jgi:hypothetical protein
MTNDVELIAKLITNLMPTSNRQDIIVNLIMNLTGEELIKLSELLRK